MIAPVLRTRSAIEPSSAMPNVGSDFTRLRNTVRLMASSWQSDSATAFAERGDWSMSAISPNTPPGPTSSTTAPRIGPGVLRDQHEHRVHRRDRGAAVPRGGLPHALGAQDDRLDADPPRAEPRRPARPAAADLRR